MKRNCIIQGLIVICFLLSVDICAGQDANPSAQQIKKLNSLLKLNSFTLENEQTEQVDEWETSYLFTFSKGKLTVEYDEETHYYSQKKLKGSFVYKGIYEFDPKNIDPESIQVQNDVSNAMVNILCKRKGCVRNEFSAIDFDANKKEKYRRDHYTKKARGFNINVSGTETQEAVVGLLKEIVGAK